MGRIELVGLGATGTELARIGSRAKPSRSATSRDEAQAQGALAGFVPVIAMPKSFSCSGDSITPEAAARRGLSCDQDRREVRCFDPLKALDAAQGADQCDQ